MDLSTDVIFGDGIDNMAGITRRAYIGFVSAFTTLQVPTANPAQPADRVTIASAHVLATGKKTIELYVMYDKSGIESPLVGNRKGKSHKPKATLMYPGTDADCAGLYDLIKNGDLVVFLTPQEGTGYLQIGTANLPASLVAGSLKTGTSPDGEKGITFEIEAPSRTPILFYNATLPRVGA